MPDSPEELDAELAKQDQLTSQARQGGLAGMVPAAAEPLKESNLNVLAQTLASAVPVLSSGQVPEVQFAEVVGPQEMVPQDIASQVLATAAFVDHATGKIDGIEQYAFNPVEMMATNKGIIEATSIISAMAEDENILGALQAAPTARAEMPVKQGSEAPPEA